jgi:N-acetylmuramoyl-L-alanine amidase
MQIVKHKLTPDFADFEEINKTSGSFESGLPDTIVIHYTGSGSAASTINTFKDSDINASAHVVVDYDGSITQLIPFHKIAWHAGRSSWLDRTGLNDYSIGIEIVNAGRLEKSGNVWRSWFGRTYQEEEVVHAVHKNESIPSWWHRYTEAQISTVLELCKAIMKSYDIRFILGHDEISPGRKTDPGPAFPMEKLRDRLLYNNLKDDADDSGREALAKGIVHASALNIRSGPGAGHKTIADPLSRNTELTILEEKDGWFHVEIPIRGWVSGKFVKKAD